MTALTLSGERPKTPIAGCNSLAINRQMSLARCRGSSERIREDPILDRSHAAAGASLPDPRLRA
jgi:hypothetical protein